MLVSVQELQSFIERAACKTGVSSENAKILSEHLIRADCRGISTHGICKFPVYLKNLYYKKVNPTPDIRIKATFPAALSVDGDNGLGSVIMTKALRAAMDAAKTYGIAVAGVRNCNHIGACGYYSDIAAKEGFVSIVSTEAFPLVAPFGAAQPYFGTNPFSIGMPREDACPVVADMATSIVPRGKINQAMRLGQKIPEGWALDKDGNPTTDPAAANKGMLLPIAGHKGSALAMAVSFFCGVMTGANFGFGLSAGFDIERTKKSDIGAFIFVMKKDAFVDEESYDKRMADFCKDIKSLKTAPGFNEILLPGEPEARREAGSCEKGIEIDDKLLSEIREAAALVGMESI